MRLGREQRRLIQIIAGGAVYFAALLIKTDEPAIKPALFLAAFLIAGGTVLWSAARNIFRGEIFDENFLMAVASSGAFAIGEYSEGVAVMLFYQIGELLQNRAVNKSRKSIKALMDIRPDFANIRRGDTIERVSPDEVGVGDPIVIKPGERVPLDAVVTEGSSTLDTSALTGESTPREVAPGDTILSGSINSGGLLTARTTKLFGDSTASRILELVESAQSKKSSSENFITKFARYYTPAVVGFAALLAAVPPLVIDGALFSDWLYRALVFLVISCPCALVISVPLSFFGGIGGASRSGILIKGGNYLEALAKTETVAFDKTGTLTKGVFGVQKFAPSGVSEGELLEMAAYAESYSNHPISLSLKRAYGSEPDGSRVSDAEELPGCGVTAVLDGRRIAAGNAKLMEKLGIKYAETASEPGTVVHVAADGVYAGYIVIADELKEDAAFAVSRLRGAGVKNFVLLTGDSKQIGERAASQLGIDRAYSELLPADKVGLVEELLKEKSPRGKLVFVGDGINDAPVLARADIGVAMGGLGSDAAIEAADAVIMNDEPSKLADAIIIARKTLRIASQNIVLALSVKGFILLIGVFGMASMWAAVFADVGVAVLAILNSLRTLNVKR